MQPPRMYYALDNLGGYDGLFNGSHVLASAGLAWNNPGDDFSLSIPPHPETLLVDSGGFQATSTWNLEYPYSVRDYFRWAETIGADYVALPDYACEPDLHESTVGDRVERTIQHHRRAWRLYSREHWPFDVLPVVQGYEREQYRYCAREFYSLGLPMDYWAIGTVCKRTDSDAIHAVLTALEDECPNTDWHMFGLTLNGWKDTRLWGRFRSADTAAWNWGGKSTEHKKELFKEYKTKVESIQTRIAEQTTL